MFWRKKQERDLDRELQSHLELEAEERGGDEHAARRAFGNKTLIQEDTRAAWGWNTFEQLWRDLAQGARMMRRRPMFTAVAVLSLAIGIGANTAIFSFLNAILIRTLPAPGANRLVLLRQTNTAFRIENCCFSYGLFQQLSANDPDFEDMTVVRSQSVLLREDGPAKPVIADFVAGNYFALFGGQAALGRLLNDADNQADGTGAVAVINTRLWRDRFGASPDVIGRRILLNAEPFQIVGVTAGDFPGSSLYVPRDIQVPASMMGKVASIPRDGGAWAEIMGRLRSGVSQEQALERLNAIGKPIERASGEKIDDRDNFNFLDGSQGLQSRKEQLGRPTQVLMLLVGILLLIACANLSALLLVRSIERSKETGLRVALGASKHALFRQYFSESLLLACCGGLAGAGLAWILIRFLAGYLVTQNPELIARVKLDGDVLSFSALLTASTAVMFGTLPAWRAMRADPLPALQGNGFAGKRRPVTARWMIAMQVALSLTLLFCAGLFTRTLANLRAIDLGFPAENLIVLRPRLDGTLHAGKGRTPFFRELMRRAAELPGVRSASLGQISPLSGSMSGTSLNIPGYSNPKGGLTTTNINFISRGYFQTLGVPFLAGEDLPDVAPAEGERPVVVNQEFARLFFSGNALGQHFQYSGNRSARVVGVVGVTRYLTLQEEPQPIMYIPISALGGPGFLQVRATADPAQTMEQLRALVKSVDAAVTIESVSTFETQLDEVLSRERLLAFLSTLLGGIAVALSAIGLYGVLAFSVVRRTREVGIRVAVGATRAEIVGLFLKEGAWPVLGGVLVGVPLALACGRLATTLLYGLEPQDAPTALGATGLLLTVAVVAAMIPAWRASRLDPTTALRQE